eukprot:m.126195 g.126195  ORF g.126195 m.126195 type:complete len:121 (-) comp13822_c0_seq2:207-569(-)
MCLSRLFSAHVHPFPIHVSCIACAILDVGALYAQSFLMYNLLPPRSLDKAATRTAAQPLNPPKDKDASTVGCSFVPTSSVGHGNNMYLNDGYVIEDLGPRHLDKGCLASSYTFVKRKKEQ